MRTQTARSSNVNGSSSASGSNGRTPQITEHRFSPARPSDPWVGCVWLGRTVLPMAAGMKHQACVWSCSAGRPRRAATSAAARRGFAPARKSSMRVRRPGPINSSEESPRTPGAVSRARRTQRPGTGPDDDPHSRLISPYTHEFDTSPFTTQSSRNVPSRTNPSFSRTRADAALRVSVSAWTRFRSSVSNAHCNKARAASVA